MPLRVAIIHYHLRTGGVTRIIQHAASALAQEGIETIVLAGEPAVVAVAGAKGVAAVAGLGYNESGGSPRRLVEKLEAAARRLLGAPPDLWHFHNHSLGKNPSVPLAVQHLAERGDRLLLQIHDFAEDGRPENYRLLLDQLGGGDIGKLGTCLYPQCGNVHYAALNNRDLRFMASAGVSRNRLHFLPNAVCLEPTARSMAKEGAARQNRLFLYPTRAIRRKNLGEFLFWAAASGGCDRFAVTLAPKNPRARPIYERWVHFAQSLCLPVEFNIAAKRKESFAELLQLADAIATTSMAEGFGMSFLEPWLAGRPLVGRNLPEITGDFEAAGLDLSTLYARLDVPLEWIGKETLRKRIDCGLRDFFQAYGRKPVSNAAECAFASFVESEMVDFGRLDEPLQEQIVQRIWETAGDRKRTQPSFLQRHGEAKSVIEQNRQAVTSEFGLERYGKRLFGIYERVVNSDTSPCDDLSAEKLLGDFLAPERFSLLRASVLPSAI